MSWREREREEEEEREKNAIYSGHLRLCQQPRAAHALRSDQFTKNSGLPKFAPLVARTLLGSITKNSGVPKLLYWSHALCSDQ